MEESYASCCLTGAGAIVQLVPTSRVRRGGTPGRSCRGGAAGGLKASAATSATSSFRATAGFATHSADGINRRVGAARFRPQGRGTYRLASFTACHRRPHPASTSPSRWARRSPTPEARNATRTAPAIPVASTAPTSTTPSRSSCCPASRAQTTATAARRLRRVRPFSGRPPRRSAGTLPST